jgi:hypothetical protein
MWICPPCASPHASGYVWTPADLFVHPAFLPPVILIASCLFSPPVGRPNYGAQSA